MIEFDKLNLASGETRHEGFINIDKVLTKNVDYAVDLEVFPWPIMSGSVSEVICNHYIEHTPMETYGKRLVRMVQAAKSWEDFQAKVTEIDLEAPSDGLILFMNELHRILKPRGLANIVTPYYQGSIAWQDPTHRRGITEITFQYFNKEWREKSQLGHYGITTDFEVKLKGYDLFKDVTFKDEEMKKFGMRTYNNVIVSMYTELRKK